MRTDGTKGSGGTGFSRAWGNWDFVGSSGYWAWEETPRARGVRRALLPHSQGTEFPQVGPRGAIDGGGTVLLAFVPFRCCDPRRRFRWLGGAPVDGFQPGQAVRGPGPGNGPIHGNAWGLV